MSKFKNATAHVFNKDYIFANSVMSALQTACSEANLVGVNFVKSLPEFSVYEEITDKVIVDYGNMVKCKLSHMEFVKLCNVASKMLNELTIRDVAFTISTINIGNILATQDLFDDETMERLIAEAKAVPAWKRKLKKFLNKTRWYNRLYSLTMPSKQDKANYNAIKDNPIALLAISLILRNIMKRWQDEAKKNI